MSAPLGQAELIEVGRAFVLGGTGVLTLLLLAGAAAYLLLCARSSRQWDGLEHRWRRPGR